MFLNDGQIKVYNQFCKTFICKRIGNNFYTFKIKITFSPLSILFMILFRIEAPSTLVDNCLPIFENSICTIINFTKITKILLPKIVVLSKIFIYKKLIVIRQGMICWHNWLILYNYVGVYSKSHQCPLPVRTFFNRNPSIF